MTDGKVVREAQDMRYLSWTRIRHSSGTAGSFLKAYSDLGDKKRYYKLSNYNACEGIIGHECVNEVIADRLLTILGIEHLPYRLIHALVTIDDREYETWLCESDDFKQPGESKLALDAYYEAERQKGESLYEFCTRNGWEGYLHQMLLTDFLILNRDRHGANIEVLRNSKKKTIRLAPLFDHGLSLLFSCPDEESVRRFDVMRDLRVQCCIGTGSTFENLKFIPKGVSPCPGRLTEADKETLTEGLADALPQVWLDRITEMIYGRWRVYESIRDTE